MSEQTQERSLDQLARALASGSLSRGKALRLMGGLLLGGTLGSLPGVAWANDDDRCPEGQTRCGERCVNLRFNERHCGSCFNRGRSTQTCCNGRCVNLQRNERHCGSCFNPCAEGEECVDGMCGQACVSNGGTCTGGTQCCSGNCSNGSCCPSGYVGLSNGGCAKPCTSFDDCPAGCSFCGGDIATYCLRGATSTSQSCASDIDCPSGQVCSGGAPNRFCHVAC